MGKKQKLEEEIKYRTEIVKILAFYLLTIGGGLVGLIFHLNSFFEIFSLYIGNFNFRFNRLYPFVGTQKGYSFN